MNRRKTYSYSESDDDTSTLKNSQVSSTSDYSDDFEHDSRRSTPKARPRLVLVFRAMPVLIFVCVYT